MSNIIHSDISDEKLETNFKRKFGDWVPPDGFRWYKDDDRMVYVVRELDHNEKPIIKLYRYRNLNRTKFCVPYYKQFQSDRTMEYRCFFTGSECYLLKGKLFAKSVWTIPWGITREHLVPLRRWRETGTLYNSDVATVANNNAKLNSLGNGVVCPYFLNLQMAHIPLAMKLYERDFLSKLDFDRQAMSTETALFIKDKVIEFEQPFWFVDNYPWFPHAIKDEKAKVAAYEFFQYLIDHENRFLDMSWQDQRHYIKQPCDLDIPHLAKTILGLKNINS